MVNNVLKKGHEIWKYWQIISYLVAEDVWKETQKKLRVFFKVF